MKDLGKPTLLSVDTGNFSIKTPTFIFRSAYTEYDGALGGECLEVGDKSYALCDKRMPYIENKADERYRILVMIAMAKELLYKMEKRGQRIPDVTERNVVLCMGLPPQHLKKYRDQYKEFYTGDYEFSYAGHRFMLHVTDVMVFAQCLAAANSQLGSIISQANNIYLIDIGGNTSDVLNIVKKGGDITLNFDCIRTMRKGIIRLYDSIINRIEEDMDYEIPFTDLDQYYLEPRRAVQLKEPLHEIYDEQCEMYTHNLLNGFLEDGVRLNSALPVFLGGGSAVMLPHIQSFFEARSHRYDPIFITDVRANAIGYQEMAKDALRGAV